MHHWVPLLDRFDEYFEKHLKDRRDLQLSYGEPEGAAAAVAGGPAAGAPQPTAAAQREDAPFPTEAVLQILRVTTLILEGCSNKHLYNSYEVGAALRLHNCG